MYFLKTFVLIWKDFLTVDLNVYLVVDYQLNASFFTRPLFPSVY